MTAADAPVPIATLLTHRDWVRRLARSMVEDEAAAADVEQRTWLAVLRRPPNRETAVRAWLARVVRNQALNEFRGERRRAAHERAGARGEAVRSAADVLAEAETHRRLVVAVLALDEPARTTVLLRFFEELPPREVALRMDVPVETVRTRLRRALEVLREDLAEGGGRSAWIAALAPLMGTRMSGGAPGTASVAGGGIVAGKGTVAAVATIALVAGFGGGMLARSTSAPAHDELATIERRVASLEAARAEPSLATRSESMRRGDARTADLAQRVEALEEQAATERKSVEDLATRVGASNLGRESRPTEAMSTDDLLTEIRDLSRTQWRNKVDERAGMVRILRAADVLLARKLDAARRTETLTARGIALRETDDLAGSADALREAMTVGGSASQESAEAAFQLAWTLVRQSEPRAAAESFLEAARRSDTRPALRAARLVLAAGFLGQAGDTARAKQEYRGVIDEFGASDVDFIRQQVGEAKKRLEELERGDK